MILSLHNIWLLIVGIWHTIWNWLIHVNLITGVKYLGIFILLAIIGIIIEEIRSKIGEIRHSSKEDIKHAVMQSFKNFFVTLRKIIFWLLKFLVIPCGLYFLILFLLFALARWSDLDLTSLVAMISMGVSAIGVVGWFIYIYISENKHKGRKPRKG